MILQALPAPLELSPFVSGYLYGHCDFEESRLIPSIPRGVPAMLVLMEEDREAPLENIQLNERSCIRNGIYLCGQSSQISWLRIRTCKAYMVVLKPIALSHVLGESANIFNDTYIRVDDLIPGGKFLLERLSAEKTQLGQLAVMDGFLRDLFRNKSVMPNEVDVAVESILQTHGQVKVNELSKQERVSVRTLTRKFTEQVGLSPKQYARVVRFREIVNYLLISPDASWLDVTYNFGFHDQSHLIKDFQHFTGLSPSQCLSRDLSFEGDIIKSVSSFEYK
jgi:AraC-like DNA-binding protein